MAWRGKKKKGRGPDSGPKGWFFKTRRNRQIGRKGEGLRHGNIYSGKRIRDEIIKINSKVITSPSGKG